MFTVLIAVFVVFTTVLLEYLFSFLRILLKKPLSPTGAVEIDLTEHIYAHPDCTQHLQETKAFGVDTLYGVLQHGIQLAAKKPLFSYREASNQSFKSYTHTEVFEILKEIGSGVVHFGLKPENDTFFGIYGSCTMNYALCLYSAWPYSMVPVGIYDSLGRDGVRFIIKQTEVKLIFADDLQRVTNLIEWKDETSTLKTIVCFLEPTKELMERATEKNLNLITLAHLRELGRQNPTPVVEPKPSDTAIIMYTSGSTGEPKGCIITHEAFVNALHGLVNSIGLLDFLRRKETPRVLNYLPLAHVFGCATILALTYLGGEIGFWQGKVDKLIDDFHDFKPSIITMVPRLLNKLYDRVRSESRKKGLIGRILFRLAVRSKLEFIRRGDFSQNTIWDKLIFHKVRQSFGGKMSCVVSTSAPLSAEVCAFSRAAFSCMFIECYGQTECIIGCSQTPNHVKPGETGIPTIMNYIKLVDVPEKEYYAKDGVGEICISSPALFKGYLKDEAKTREAIDEQGWLHTGDIGRWTPHKTMQIIDRKKNMYKLSQGEYIAPEKIEDVYARSRFISLVFVYGDSFESFLVAIVVLDDDYVKKWAATEGHHVQASEPDEKLKQIVLDDMTREGKKRGLMSYEQVKNIEFIKEAFTIENGLLTPTFKSRRYAVEKKYKNVFVNMYKSANNA
ncbi:unnamed protein product [Adineta ricciae]|nr:unnamed protein product [Adineta ricciae]